MEATQEIITDLLTTSIEPWHKVQIPIASCGLRDNDNTCETNFRFRKGKQL
jgi:hypothetical protein